MHLEFAATLNLGVGGEDRIDDYVRWLLRTVLVSFQLTITNITGSVPQLVAISDEDDGLRVSSVT